MSQRSGTSSGAGGSSAGAGNSADAGGATGSSGGSRRTGTATIKIAAKEASQREPTADPGPGDPLAAPSVAPELVDIPAPPTPSQLVVKSADGGSSVGLSSQRQPSGAVDPKSRSSRRIATLNEPKSGSGGGGGSAQASTATTVPREASQSPQSVGSSGGPSASQAMQAQDSTGTSGNVHDEDEEGEGEVEHPDEGAKTPDSPRADGVVAPASSGGGFAKASTRTSKSKEASEAAEAKADGAAGAGKKKRKKVTKFRYHKRITVRTKGHQNPTAIMEKVNLKDHNATLTSIDDLDPQELMRRAGIKGNDKTHWRVRLRQTKRCTKNGKTVSSTRVAYRDSEGNKKVETLKQCKHCGKKPEDCKCGSKQQ